MLDNRAWREGHSPCRLCLASYSYLSTARSRAVARPGGACRAKIVTTVRGDNSKSLCRKMKCGMYNGVDR